MDSTEALRYLRTEVDAWLDDLLPRDLAQKHLLRRDEAKVKIIRDAVLGHQTLAPHEYLIIDTPIFQRLRHIHQTAFAYFVYPTAVHTRFDHSLGVANLVSQIGKMLGLGQELVYELRLAALLHDVSQCLFSHLSEGLMENKFRELYQAASAASIFSGKVLSFSEILAYLIITSDKFMPILRRIVGHYAPGVDVSRVAQLVIGKASDDFAFLGDIISGPFDADKLDYLVRDCYFTGIRADVDVPRIILSATILDRGRFSISEYPRQYLVMGRPSVSYLEQVVFNKMLLYPAIYHHHKVRTLECMIKAIFEEIENDPELITDKELRFDRIRDFLHVTEHDFWSRLPQQTTLQPLVQRFQERNLLKRCLVLSDSYIEGDGRHDVLKLSSERNPEEMKKIRQLVWDEIPRDKRTHFNALWVDFPRLPSIGKDADQCFVDDGTATLKKLAEFFPYPRWVESYQETKWKGFVFYEPDQDFRLAANLAARRTFRELGLELSSQATEECKLPYHPLS